MMIGPGKFPGGEMQLCDGKLAVVLASHPEFKPFALDFCAPRELARLGQSLAGDPLLRALGKNLEGLTIWDFTLGLGQDALVFARLGLAVYAWERSPLVFALWSDAAARALANPRLYPIMQRIQVRLADARMDGAAAMAASGIPRANIIYLDPMYPGAAKAKSKRRKEMVILRELAGEDADAGALFAAAEKLEPARIIVKRPRHAECLASRRAPNLQFHGKSHRFDVYLK